MVAIWENSQEVTAVTQKKTNKIVVIFLHKNVKFSLFSFFASLFKNTNTLRSNPNINMYSMQKTWKTQKSKKEI